MINTKQNPDKKVRIVTKVLVGETLKTITPGTTAHFTRRELGNRDNSVQSAVLRLNKASKCNEYSLHIDDNDGSFWITRSRINQQ